MIYDLILIVFKVAVKKCDVDSFLCGLTLLHSLKSK